VRRFIVQMRAKLPIAIVDAYWDDRAGSLPHGTGVSHHIALMRHERAPIIQFARRRFTIGKPYQTMTQSSSCPIFGDSAKATEDVWCWSVRPGTGPVASTGARDTRSGRLRCRNCWRCSAQEPAYPGNEIPEGTGCTGFAKKHGSRFGTYNITETETPMQISN